MRYGLYITSMAVCGLIPESLPYEVNVHMVDFGMATGTVSALLHNDLESTGKHSLQMPHGTCVQLEVSNRVYIVSDNTSAQCNKNLN